jgi:hypothetical protein
MLRGTGGRCEYSSLTPDCWTGAAEYADNDGCPPPADVWAAILDPDWLDHQPTCITETGKIFTEPRSKESCTEMTSSRWKKGSWASPTGRIWDALMYFFDPKVLIFPVTRAKVVGLRN